MVTEFTPVSAAIGGALIGIACTLLLVLYGKIAGISGIVKSVFAKVSSGSRWQLYFILGLLLAGVAVRVFAPSLLEAELQLSPWLIVVAGLLVGVGTTLANGCTSGHGVCGMSRFSTRSWVATCTFMLVAFITANLVG
ncbi:MULTISPECIES: YeeE/YedE thiosulfate transporter family protein [Pseudoalteromonas]|uniref:YeeE/YedE family protein n=1 Tax=Pseudoalteromonas TaxID=53246 RepID=UPI0015CDDE5C|nr:MULTISPECIES: YeeE/YedE thiosulfate transporter family protein [unclassified Pseudoalteromonas]MBH0071552.1 YeeE/YedE family protein [Pseudoalteromonas sp. NZS127]NYR12314.1 YeeE/YedE family protein [Pseudoalteromonas sp. MIP2626]|tara:strand:+ start:336 stop:749 length:414 start_codon:yes stop_codon:yes gene_type:complete